jgi:hypothetical protein
VAEFEDSAHLIPNAYVERAPESGPSTISDNNKPLLTSIISRFFKTLPHQTFHTEFSSFFLSCAVSGIAVYGSIDKMFLLFFPSLPDNLPVSLSV